MLRITQALFMAALSITSPSAQVSYHLPPLDRAMPPRAEAIYRQLAGTTNSRVAMDVVTFMAPLWRLAGNPAFEQSQQLIFDRLAAAGLQPKYEEYPNGGQGWEYVRGTLRLGGPMVRSCCRRRRIASRSQSIRSARPLAE